MNNPRTKVFSLTKTKILLTAGTILLISMGLTVYEFFFNHTDESTGVSFLNEAYKNNRTIESRIAGFNYSPVINTRGVRESTPEYLLPDRAELVILDAVHYNPGSQSHRALGIYHLLSNRPDKAIRELEKALSFAPSNADLHSDLGAALLEMGKAELEKERLDSQFTGKPAEYLFRSLEHIHQALDITPSLKEAIFNLGLVQEQLGLRFEAVNTFSEYLKADGNSGWSNEASEKITRQEEKELAMSLSKEEVLSEFFDAFKKKDGARAWKLICSNRSPLNRKFISEMLVDAYIGQSLNLQEKDASTTLAALYFLADLESRKADEHYSKKLAEFYRNQRRGQLARLKKARDLVNRGHELYLLDKNIEALGAYGEAKKEFEKLNDRCEALSAEYRVAYCESENRNTDISLAIFERLAASCEEEGFKVLLARNLLGIASDEFSQKKYSKAIGRASRSLDVARQVGDELIAFSSLESLREFYRTIGNHRKVMTCIQKTFDYNDCSSINQLQRFNHYSLVASALSSAGYVDASLEYRKEASRFLAPDIARNTALYFADLGATYTKLNKYDEALTNLNRSYEEAQAITPESVKNLILVYTTLHKSSFHKNKQEFQEALSGYSNALNLSHSVGFPAYAYEARKGRLSCYIALGEDTMAENEIAEMLKLLENARSEILEQENRNSFFDTAQSVYDLAIEYECSRRSDFRKAFDYSEESRSRSLLDLLKTPAEAASNTALPDLKFNEVSRPRILSDIQKVMPEKLQILHYSVLAEKIIVWVISPNAFSYAALDISQEELNKRIKEYVDAISHYSGNESASISTQAKELFDILIKPVLHLSRHEENICIVPDKILNILPFETLISTATERYLIEDYAVIYSPSSSILLECIERSRSKEPLDAERLFGVGNPDFDSSVFKGLSDLPDAQREIEQIKAFYQDSKILTTVDAKESVVKNEMPKASVIHLAAHSMLAEDSPLHSKILLAREEAGKSDGNNGVLESYEIYNIRLPNTRLAVLSSCQSGIDRYYNGEGMMSLARSFMAAGVPTIVASLWKVDSNATADLMIEFHRLNRQGHLSVVESLRRAKLSMLKGSGRRFRHPYFWSAFIAVGGEADPERRPMQ